MIRLPTLRRGVSALRGASTGVLRGTRASVEWLLLQKYRMGSRRPLALGYGPYKTHYLRDVLHDRALMSTFRAGEPLPARFGYRIDPRVLEIPWALARIMEAGVQSVLDAGSSLNSEVALRSPQLEGKRVTIVTLAPERDCFWWLGVSYLFADLRDVPLKDESQDAVVCISTVEHVGMDNTRYAGDARAEADKPRGDYLAAVREMRRVLRPGGKLLLTVPFGRHENHGWFQQFDAAMVDTVIRAFEPASVQETVFRYLAQGWVLSDRVAAANETFFDVTASKYFDSSSNVDFPPHFPAGEGAVLCLELVKAGRTDDSRL